MSADSLWYQIKNIPTIDTPALAIYPDRVRENIRLAISISKGIEWLRPHVKTHKMAEVTRLMLEEGIKKFKCATIAEAEMLGLEGAPDVLLAYQPVGPKIQRLLELVKAYPKTVYSCLVDNKASVQAISDVFAAANRRMKIFLDLNVGMNRTGIVPGRDALQLYQFCNNLPGLHITGLHAYDGHLRDTDFEVRKAKCDQAFAAVTTLAHGIEAAGMETPVLVAGGSPTFPIHATRAGVECSPGTFIFWDYGYHTVLPEQAYQFAALVVTRIISIIDSQTICLDLGHKAIAAENPLPRVVFLNAPEAKPLSQSEEHMVVKVNNSKDYQPGDVWYGVPVHICPTCNLYDYAQVVENKLATKAWKVIARSRSIGV